MNIQSQIKDLLNTVDLPSREIKVYGSQITVECASLSSCQEFAKVISKFATIRKIIESLVETEHSKEHNLNAVGKKYFTVYRLYAIIK